MCWLLCLIIHIRKYNLAVCPCVYFIQGVILISGKKFIALFRQCNKETSDFPRQATKLAKLTRIIRSNIFNCYRLMCETYKNLVFQSYHVLLLAVLCPLLKVSDCLGNFVSVYCCSKEGRWIKSCPILWCSSVMIFGADLKPS